LHETGVQAKNRQVSSALLALHVEPMQELPQPRQEHVLFFGLHIGMRGGLAPEPRHAALRQRFQTGCQLRALTQGGGDARFVQPIGFQRGERRRGRFGWTAIMPTLSPGLARNSTWVGPPRLVVISTVPNVSR